MDVHWMCACSAPDLMLACGRGWTRDGVGGRGTDRPGVFSAWDGRLYALDLRLVTCEECRAIAVSRSGRLGSDWIHVPPEGL